ncbi:P2X purinoceptor 4-like isoform X1 [Octopus vulgaris]|uniref:p2X purinoceptor 4 n=1 Tax=Octopus vulgaris TaxID=6645 RepID=A0A6C0PNF2_OCTVU|nr:p2X purinoceptor 4 [Octopus vulgaris]CAI9740575.1 P2X purinoceptor 4-like isoform X1 [Octopus vulgaris]
MGYCDFILSLIFEYDTPKIVHIHSKKVGVINRLLQLIIIGYIVGYVIIYNKGYQEFDYVVGSISTKVKGISLTNRTILSDKPGIWDVADYVVPPQENGAVFVMTNAVITYNQTQRCPQDVASGDFCTSDADCPAETKIPSGDGFRTGLCVNSSQNGTKVCEIYAWCPFENDTLSEPLLKSAANFTIFIKNNVHFPKFNVSRVNVDSNMSKNCTYDPHTLKSCPIFRMSTITDIFGTPFKNVALQGASIQVNIVWNCNLDHSLDECLPEYRFTRLDRSNVVSEGFNFRFAKYFQSGDQPMRTLVKAYGIQFLVTIQGRGGKFSIVPLMLNLGSGLALLSLASVVADIIMLYVLKSKNFYREQKYQNVDDNVYSSMKEDTPITTYNSNKDQRSASYH